MLHGVVGCMRVRLGVQLCERVRVEAIGGRGLLSKRGCSGLRPGRFEWSLSTTKLRSMAREGARTPSALPRRWAASNYRHVRMASGCLRVLRSHFLRLRAVLVLTFPRDDRILLSISHPGRQPGEHGIESCCSAVSSQASLCERSQDLSALERILHDRLSGGIVRVLRCKVYERHDGEECGVHDEPK